MLRFSPFQGDTRLVRGSSKILLGRGPSEFEEVRGGRASRIGSGIQRAWPEVMKDEGQKYSEKSEALYREGLAIQEKAPNLVPMLRNWVPLGGGVGPDIRYKQRNLWRASVPRSEYDA